MPDPTRVTFSISKPDLKIFHHIKDNFSQDEKYGEAQTKIKKLKTDKKDLVAVIKTKEFDMSELEKKLVSVSEMLMQKMKIIVHFA